MSLVVSNKETDDPHEILGVGKQASKEEIKKAYKQKALKTHPDQGGDIEQFRKVNHAYNTLIKDQEYLQRYERVKKSSSNAKSGGRKHSSNGDTFLYQSDQFDDIFLDILKGFGLSHIINNGQIYLTYEEFINGGELTTAWTNTKVVNQYGKVLNEITCPQCNGDMGINGSSMMSIAISFMGGGCERCNGKGKILPPDCHYEEQEEVYNFYIAPWTAPGSSIIVGGQNCTLKAKKHKFLSHNGNDLIYHYSLHLPEAMLGHTNYPLKLGDKRMKLDSNRPVIRFGDEDVLRNRGFLPISGGSRSFFGGNNASKERGNLIVSYKIETPSLLHPEERKFFEQWEQKMLQKALPSSVPSKSNTAPVRKR